MSKRDEEREARRTKFTRTREDTLLARKLRREASETEKTIWPHLTRSQMGAPFRRQYRAELRLERGKALKQSS